MNNLWNDEEAARFRGELAQRVYTSRLLGADPSLVLHGGGNTSVKLRETNIFGEEEDVLYVKGRGANLASIEAGGFSPCRLHHLVRLTQLPSLSDEDMERELKLSMTRTDAPTPSVETLLHAILPARYVDHTHADALISIMNTPNGTARVRELYGDSVVIIPYTMPGFMLVRFCLEHLPQSGIENVSGIVLMHHGLFSFGETAKLSYERMIELVDRAEKYLASHDAWQLESAQAPKPLPPRAAIAALRADVSQAAGAPLIMSTHADAQALGFACRYDLATLSQQGGVTPDHVIRTKRVPMIGRDVGAYCFAYREYVRTHGSPAVQGIVDPAPRVILDVELGMCVLGRTPEDAAIAEDIYRHSIDIMLRAEKLGGWRALPEWAFFEVEYWDMERTKLRCAKDEPVFSGEVALVTGAASGIGKACVAALLARGAAVCGLDIAPSVVDLYKRKDYLGIACDLTKEVHIDHALDACVRRFGGLDMLILNAGIFPKSSPIAQVSTESWCKTMSINLDANLILLRESYPLLRIAPRHGRVVFIGSKNVAAPGPGAAAYSASKAALQQLARVAALEWGGIDGIRVNTLHPNAVFDTGIWTPEILAERAASYGMTVENYKTNNVLKVEVTSHHVAELAAELCGAKFGCTTGAQIPVDGGNLRII